MIRLHPPFASNSLATRSDAQQFARDLFEPLTRDFGPGRARVRCSHEAASFGRTAAELEGFSRPLWGIAPLVAGGGRFDHLDHFIEGLSNGADPDHPEYWGQVGDYDQRAVEMAAIGHALAIAPEAFWDPLPGRAKDHLAAWLLGIEKVVVHDDNWHFFVVLVQQGLERVGIPIDRSVRDFHLDRIETFYLGDGWYGDGPEGFADHYNGYALHCYGLLYAHLNRVTDPARSERYVERATTFAQSFRLWFGSDGASVPFGRSMTYRFGMASVWAALAIAGVEACSWNEIRGLWARHLRWWAGQPMADRDGRLTIGYRNANALVAEQYNSPNSPYWAMKSLLPLSLAEAHPFWQAGEQPAAVEAELVAVPAARFVVRRQDGNAMLLPGGPTVESVRNAPDKYGKFAYSSAFGFCVESDRWLHLGFAGDNVLALSPDGRHWRVRETVLSGRIEQDRLHTSWAPWDGCEIETVQLVLSDWEIRAHRVQSTRHFECVESGFVVPGSTVTLTSGIAGPAVESGGAASALLDLSGRREAGVRPVMPNTNIMFPQAVVPVLAGSVAVGETLLVSAVAAFRDGLDLCPPPVLERVADALEAAGFPAFPSGTRPHRRSVPSLIHA
ncbi:MAG: DUF2264 domain-containing protein [Devosia sp.]|nr:DUF2264 domain-containing protein [Devosia sp.]